ncbi:hypothetical protein PFNF54_02685, partial [Plasmodium falciparum NF54]
IYNQRNYYITPRHTETNRSLCECELYSPTNYDNDPEMKRVMQQFVDRTTQRFHEYDERMKTTRQKCKERCDKEIQKIILKHKLEKELMDKFATLHTDIQSDAIPTCVCEKSLADKTEKFCHNCGYGLGSVAPNIGLLGGPGIYVWKIAALAAAKEFAEKAGAAMGKAAGDAAGAAELIRGLKALNIDKLFNESLGLVFDGTNYNNTEYIFKAIFSKFNESCMPRPPGSVPGPVIDRAFCDTVDTLVLPSGTGSQTSASTNAVIKEYVKPIVSNAKFTAEATAQTAAEEATNLALKTNTNAVNATYASSQTAIIVSIAAIVVIVLVMIIIYLILRYRRKKKMKKKLQYIKLLEE